MADSSCLQSVLTMTDRASRRVRLAALDDAIAAIEGEWGGFGEMVMDDHAPEVALKDCNYGFPPNTRANSVKLSTWEVFMLLTLVRDKYRARLRRAEDAGFTAVTEEVKP